VTLSNDALQSALSQWTDECWLECLTFEHSSLSAPIRLVNDRQDLVRTPGTFTAFPFAVKLHERTEDGFGQAEIRADGVDQSLIDDLRSIEHGLTVTYELVLLSSPNTVEHGPIEFEVRSIVANAGTISLLVAFALNMLGEAHPKDYFAPWNSAD
jgi:hypothetical protein